MTINQAIDQLTSGKKLTPDQEKLKVSLIQEKIKRGGRIPVDNEKKVKEILEQEPDEKDQDPA